MNILKHLTIPLCVAFVILGTSLMGTRDSFKTLVILSRAADHNKMMSKARPFLEKIADHNNFGVEITDDTSLLNDQNLRKYQVLVQLQQAPFDMSTEQQGAVQRFIEQGNGWVGIHAAGLTGKDFGSPDVPYWQWFESLMGDVIYSPHPEFQKGTVVVEDRKHPVTRNLPQKFEVSDEWYEFNKSPRPNVHVLAVADESTYKQNIPMGDHPIIWTNPNFRRVVYIGIGHDASLCDDKNYQALIRDAIIWAANR